MLSIPDIRNIASKDQITRTDFQLLISPEALTHLEVLAQFSREITLRRFGRMISLYVPLYLSSYCVNSCSYCGFNAHNNIVRSILSEDQVRKELKTLRNEGFGHVLLLTGEAPQKTPTDWISHMVYIASEIMDHVSVEVFPMSKEEYKQLVKAGCDAVTVYQETYDRKVYSKVHPSGPKKDYDWRYETPIRAAQASMRGVGLGFLAGLAPWRQEALAMYDHALKLMETDWKVRPAFSFPRLRPHAGHFEVPHPVTDAEIAQLIFALRIAFPDAEIVLSTRESAEFRNGFIGLGVTRMSAGSSTKVGGYSETVDQTGQFEICDDRPPSEIADTIWKAGYEPVWKDWDRVFSE